MEVFSRKEAKDRGLKRYFTGKPCKYGHLAQRYIANNACVQCQDERNAEYRSRPESKVRALEYMKIYRKVNKEEITKQKAGYYLRKKLNKSFDIY